MMAAVFERVAFAHPWALLALLFAPPAVWLLARRRQRMPRLLPWLDLVHIPELGRQNNLALGRDDDLHN